LGLGLGENEEWLWLMVAGGCGDELDGTTINQLIYGSPVIDACR
jgi:hypothetical protein